MANPYLDVYKKALQYFFFSISGHTVSQHAGSHFYSASKFAVNALTESLRQELHEAKLNIRVTVSSSGTILSKTLEDNVAEK